MQWIKDEGHCNAIDKLKLAEIVEAIFFTQKAEVNLSSENMDSEERRSRNSISRVREMRGARLEKDLLRGKQIPLVMMWCVW
jgi:hypothetical protein